MSTMTRHHRDRREERHPDGVLVRVGEPAHARPESERPDRQHQRPGVAGGADARRGSVEARDRPPHDRAAGPHCTRRHVLGAAHPGPGRPGDPRAGARRVCRRGGPAGAGARTLIRTKSAAMAIAISTAAAATKTNTDVP